MFGPQWRGYLLILLCLFTAVPFVALATEDSGKPSLIPLPHRLNWTSETYPLASTVAIVISNDSLSCLAGSLQEMLNDRGVSVPVKNGKAGRKPTIELMIGPVTETNRTAEAYELTVTSKRISIRSSSQHGIFNGIQTLRQLMRNDSRIQGVEISDYPAFAWRGYMVDVGRNYQSMELLKQQIDQISRMKLNIFHFHLTEDVAWRLQIKRYPQLTRPETMTRFAGQSYSEEELKELIQYCKDRFITLIPEIDMPGHSAAFTRAMGYNMQSDSGLITVKQILEDFCDTYDVPYVHIGADEVEITNEAFLPAMIETIEKKGKKVMGWEPGGNFTNSVIRQLWMDNLGKLPNINLLELVDSRNLYINHMDAQESVVSILNHAMLDRQEGDQNYRGAILCLWNDRRLESGEDNFVYNPVYPSILAFSERIWRGGGETGNPVSITSDNLEAFTEFENRLIDIKKTFFRHLPFNYVAQAHLRWELAGPYPNEGNLARTFAPERGDFDFSTASNVIPAYGGTVILRHFWDPVVKGFLKEPQENSTYYARSRYYSEADTTALMWIGFYDFSRSTKSATPAKGTWNDMQSKIWLNGQLIDPPLWARAGQDGDLEIPYIDENYYSRPPTPVKLKKGWNEIVIKAPVGSFNSGIWYSPVKWMFSAMIVEPADSPEKQPAKSGRHLDIGKGYVGSGR